MKTSLAPGNGHPSRSGRVDLTSVMTRGRDLIVTTTIRTSALPVAVRLVASPREGLNPLEVVPRLHASAIRAGLITTLRVGKSKTNAGSAGAEDMKAGKKTQTRMDIKAAGAIFGFRALAPASAENTEQG